MSRNPYMTTYISAYGHHNSSRSRSNRIPSDQPRFSRRVDNRRPEPTVTDNRTGDRPSRERAPANNGDVGRNPTYEFPDLAPEIGIPEEDSDDGLDSEELEVRSVNVLASENAYNHHTDEYYAVEVGTLVVRRGQPFDIILKCNRKVNLKRDILRLVFETGENATDAKGTKSECIINSKDDSSGWRVIRKKGSDTELRITVFTPSECVVSKWKMLIQNLQTIDGRTKPVSLADPIDFYILFNAWNKDDDVYFQDKKRLKEYILNETGFLYQGNPRNIRAQPWNFGQFEPLILEAAILCMQKGLGLKEEFDKRMGQPLLVTRGISKIVNSNDDKGVLKGNWSGSYGSGTPPTRWAGSVSILRKYMSSGPVEWGQCWVYSGIVTTICRALGIPCRSVTNFESAHDTDGNLTIDTFVDTDTGEVVPYSTKDSIWNYHAWNECWMKRPDLGAQGVDGWQVVDATPQERSNGKFQCGPTSVNAIKNGMVDLLFDGPFVCAEVNGDQIFWVKEKDGRKTILKTDTSRVGQKISTKDPDSNQRMDITKNYKHLEGSEEERNAVMKAVRLANKRKPIHNNGGINDVKFNGFEGKDHIYIGSDFEVGGVIENNSREIRNVKVTISCKSTKHNGSFLAEIQKKTVEGELQPRQTAGIFLKVREKDYIKKISKEGNLMVYLLLKVKETDQQNIWSEDFLILRPELTIEMKSKSVSLREIFEFTISVKNPLPEPLTSCYVTVEGPVKEAGRILPIGTIGADKLWKAIMSLTPTRPGRGRKVIVTLNSDEIDNITGVAEFDVFRN